MLEAIPLFVGVEVEGDTSLLSLSNTSRPRANDQIGGLLAGDDVGVSPGNDGVRRFVESEDTINESS
ncbi:hypothetical protein ACQX3P_11765, partial [Corynebacterium diphtheriae]